MTNTNISKIEVRNLKELISVADNRNRNVYVGCSVKVELNVTKASIVNEMRLKHLFLN